MVDKKKELMWYAGIPYQQQIYFSDLFMKLFVQCIKIHHHL